jgi:hypothetical protein
MDVTINVTPEAVWIMAILGWILGEELDPESLTDRKTAPSECLATPN